MGKGVSPHSKADVFGVALVGARRFRHYFVSSGSYHSEKWQMVEFPSGEGQARRTYYPRHELMQHEVNIALVQEGQN